MNVDARTLRPYVPLLVLIATVGLGWIVFVRPLSADRARAATDVESLRQREMALRRELSTSAPRATGADPAAAFERRVASGNASPALLEQLARLASAARARNLLIETVEAAAIGGVASPQTTAPQTAPRDPRFGLFDVPVTHVPIRVAFDTDYAGVGRFLWAFRDLPTTVEIRALSVGLAPVSDETPSTPTDALRVSLTLHAYSRPVPVVVHASITVGR